MTDPNRKERTGANAPWPKGKPRNPPTRQWLALRARIQKLLDAQATRALPPELRRSYRGIGETIGVSPRTVKRWIDGEKNPSPQYVESMAALVESWVVKRRGKTKVS